VLGVVTKAGITCASEEVGNSTISVVLALTSILFRT
jgi:hypothetical protein